MPGFGVTPVGPFPDQVGDTFPDYIQFQNQGVNLGEPDASTVNFGAGMAATRGVGENENKITVTAAPGAIAWRYIDGDDTILAADAQNGIVSRATTGAVALNLPPDVLPDGQSVLIVQKGAAIVSLILHSGIELILRNLFTATTAGQGAIITVTALGNGAVIVSGDVGTA